MRILLWSLVLCALVAGTRPAWGQQPDGTSLAAVWDAYQQLDYAAAADSARAALDRFERYTPGELAELHVILGLIAFSQNTPGEARGEFANALTLNPSLELDSLQVSPKILDFFGVVRAEWRQARQQEARADPATVRYVVVEDRRVEAALRSMVLPGWGQLHKGQRTKGQVMMGVWGVLAGSTVAAHVLRGRARDRYDNAGTASDALDRYDTFNTWHQARNALLLGAAGFWIYSYVDALVGGGPPGAPRRFQAVPGFSGVRPNVVIHVRF